MQTQYDEVPSSLELLTTSSELDIRALNVRYYDEVLAQSVRHFIFTQDPAWEERCHFTVSLLDAEIASSGTGLGFQSVKVLSINRRCNNCKK